MFKWRELYGSYVNLSHRIDRNLHMQNELKKIDMPFIRQEGIKTKTNEWNIHPYKKMFNRTPGAIGCMLSQMAIMKKAYELGKGCIVFEDDLVICSDINERLDYIEEFVNSKEPDTDIIFLGGTVHINPSWWHKKGHEPMLTMCGCNLMRDAELINDDRMIRVYGMFSTHAYAIPYNKIPKILRLLNESMSLSIGIDFTLIIHQPKLKCFAFLPGCIKQFDNPSDIGNGITKFSGFSKLGPYWWADKMNEFSFKDFNFGEAKIN